MSTGGTEIFPSTEISTHLALILYLMDGRTLSLDFQSPPEPNAEVIRFRGCCYFITKPLMLQYQYDAERWGFQQGTPFSLVTPKPSSCGWIGKMVA